MVDATLYRLVLGFLGASAIALWAKRATMLSRSGAVAAVMAGTIACLGGWHLALLLAAFFLSSSSLSLLPGTSRGEPGDIIAKGSRRDARQVFANGGAFTICALVSAYSQNPAWTAAALGSIFTATADTWATELGLTFGGQPRSAVSWKRVPPGTSGAVTAAGTVGMFLGAGFMGTVAVLAGVDTRVAVIGATAGVLGAVTDTLLGATIQERRMCATCNRQTERVLHSCGRTTDRSGGIRGFDNDLVNLTSTICGGIVAWLLILSSGGG